MTERTEPLAYEVETRAYFSSQDEAYAALPFLPATWTSEITWETGLYGLELYRSDQLLRLSSVIWNQQEKTFLGYKDKDTGSFCNIRRELDEDMTSGLTDSLILRIISGKSLAVAPDCAGQTLESLGHHRFMWFAGHSLAGQSGQSGLSFKLMFCPALPYPLLLEIEKIAGTMAAALAAEREIEKFIRDYQLLSRIVRKEPPALLYESKII